LIVLDASAMTAFLLPDEMGLSKESFEAALEAGAIAPAYFRVEVTSGLLKAIRRGRLKGELRQQTLALADQWLDAVDTSFEPPMPHTIFLAEQHGLSAYDAGYLWLTVDRGGLLLTDDGPLHRVARKLGIAA
jgi:predicted nucleic acid-binding protein